MKQILKKCFVALLAMIPILSSCRDDDPIVDANYAMMPAEKSGLSYEDVSKALEQFGLTFTVDKDNRQITAKGTKAIGSSTQLFDLTYYFDKNGKSRYVMQKFANQAAFDNCLATLKAEGFVAKEVKTAGEWLLENTAKNLMVALSSSTENGRPGLSMIVASIDEGVTSWVRTSIMHDPVSGFWAPLIGEGASTDLMFRFESRMAGHTLDATASKIDKGVYVFKTGNPDFPEVRYWFDVKKKMFLEEAAVFVNKDKRPTPESVHNFLTSMGYRLTIAVDKDRNQNYYRKEDKSVALVMMNEPTDGSAFTPGIQFFYANLDDKLAPETIDFPFPIDDLGKMTMAEALEAYKQQPYYNGTEQTEMGTLIKTISKDFPSILIWEGEGALAGKYTMALVIADQVVVINSPLLPKALEAKGYVHKPDLMIPTYINKAKNTSAQIDLKGDFGMYCVAFQPNEF